MTTSVSQIKSAEAPVVRKLIADLERRAEELEGAKNTLQKLECKLLNLFSSFEWAKNTIKLRKLENILKLVKVEVQRESDLGITQLAIINSLGKDFAEMQRICSKSTYLVNFKTIRQISKDLKEVQDVIKRVRARVIAKPKSRQLISKQKRELDFKKSKEAEDAIGKMLSRPVTKSELELPKKMTERIKEIKREGYKNALVAFMDQNGGSEYDKVLHTHVPTNETAVHDKWLQYRDKIKAKLGPVLPQAGYVHHDGSPGSFQWENDAESVEELHEMATSAAPDMMRFLDKIASDVNAKTTYGPENRFVVKSFNGLKEKVENRMPWAANPLAVVNDVLRGTIIVNSITQARQLIDNLNAHVAENGMKIAYSNKFEANYPSGYVGIHAALHYAHPVLGKNILVEIQIHFDEIESGTENCPQQSAHHAYEVVRTIDATTKTEEEKEEIRRRGNLAIKTQFAFGMGRVTGAIL